MICNREEISRIYLGLLILIKIISANNIGVFKIEEDKLLQRQELEDIA